MDNLGQKLYEALPQIYKGADSQQSPQFPLKRYLQVLGAGLDEMAKYVDDFRKSQNVDTCPKELLPLLARMYGLDFPYDMDESSQRKFLKVLPKLYASKGTEDAFKYLAREIFGASTNLTATIPTKPDGMTDEEWLELKEWQKILISLEVDGDVSSIGAKHQNFLKFCEIIRPVNTSVVPFLSQFFSEVYDFLNNVNDPYFADILKDVEELTYKGVTEEDYDKYYLFTPAEDEEFIASVVLDDMLDVIKDIESDIRSVLVYDDGLDFLQYAPEDDVSTLITNEVYFRTKIIPTRPDSLLNNLGVKLNTSFYTNSFTPEKTQLDY